MKTLFVQEMFDSAVRQFGRHRAIEHGGRSISYKELDLASESVTQILHSAGCDKGSVVAVLTADRVSAITAMIGIFKAGSVCLPLDPEYPVHFRRDKLDKIAPKVVFADSALHGLFESLPSARVIDLQAVLSEKSEEDGKVRKHPAYGLDDPAYLYFTSGSSGFPKAITGRLGAIGNFLHWETKTFAIGSGTRVSQLTNLTFDASLRDIFAPLCFGGVCCVPEDKHVMWDGEKLAAWIQQNEINIVHCVPSVFRLLCHAPLEKYRFDTLTHILMSGEAILAADVSRWFNALGNRIQLVNLYGPSEATMVQVWHRITDADIDAKYIPVGRPIDGVEVLVLDKNNQPSPIETVGEICIRSRYLSLGYYKSPELTQKSFISNPLTKDPEDRIYRTGDLGMFREDGELVCLGRSDHQVKIRGVRIELEEVENTIRSCEWVKDAAVITLSDATGLVYLCAFVVLDLQGSIDSLKGVLQGYLVEAAVPSRFIQVEMLPHTVSGKVDRQQLVRSASSDFPVGPEVAFSPTEQSVSAIWSEMLKRKIIHPNTDFFAVGGHSLMVMQMLSRMRSLFGVEIGLGEFLQKPTIAALAGLIEAAILENSSNDAIDSALRAVQAGG